MISLPHYQYYIFINNAKLHFPMRKTYCERKMIKITKIYPKGEINKNKLRKLKSAEMHTTNTIKHPSLEFPGEVWSIRRRNKWNYDDAIITTKYKKKLYKIYRVLNIAYKFGCYYYLGDVDMHEITLKIYDNYDERYNSMLLCKFQINRIICLLGKDHMKDFLRAHINYDGEKLKIHYSDAIFGVTQPICLPHFYNLNVKKYTHDLYDKFFYTKKDHITPHINPNFLEQYKGELDSLFKAVRTTNVIFPNLRKLILSYSCNEHMNYYFGRIQSNSFILEDYNHFYSCMNIGTFNFVQKLTICNWTIFKMNLLFNVANKLFPNLKTFQINGVMDSTENINHSSYDLNIKMYNLTKLQNLNISTIKLAETFPKKIMANLKKLSLHKSNFEAINFKLLPKLEVLIIAGKPHCLNYNMELPYLSKIIKIYNGMLNTNETRTITLIINCEHYNLFSDKYIQKVIKIDKNIKTFIFDKLTINLVYLNVIS